MIVSALHSIYCSVSNLDKKICLTINLFKSAPINYVQCVALSMRKEHDQNVPVTVYSFRVVACAEFSEFCKIPRKFCIYSQRNSCPPRLQP